MCGTLVLLRQAANFHILQWHLIVWRLLQTKLQFGMVIYQYRLWKLNSISEQHQILCLCLLIFLNLRWIATLCVQFSEQKGILEKNIFFSQNVYLRFFRQLNFNCSLQKYIHFNLIIQRCLFENIWQIRMPKLDHSSFINLYDFLSWVKPKSNVLIACVSCCLTYDGSKL